MRGTGVGEGWYRIVITNRASAAQRGEVLLLGVSNVGEICNQFARVLDVEVVEVLLEVDGEGLAALEDSLRLGRRHSSAWALLQIAQAMEIK